MDIKKFYSLNVSQANVPIITKLNDILKISKNIRYLESNIDQWTIKEAYCFYQTMYLHFVTTSIVYSYDFKSNTIYILKGKNQVQSILFLINDDYEVPLSLFGEEDDNKLYKFSELPFNIKHRLYNTMGIFYNIKQYEETSYSNIMNELLRYS